ncbi:MAG: lytic transglycosylase [Rubrivivax sp. SCN 71-131]|jgi:soluble lytic murein transglycosylase|nr:MAG: lytic transglycosylase [Rubrivivax sp. SCN 71-131]
MVRGLPSPRGARLARLLLPALFALIGTLGGAAAVAQVGDEAVVRAREALGQKDGARLAALRGQLLAARHPLAVWADYWELSSRLTTAEQPEVDAFYARWRGSYLEDRLRNDWLLELGRRGDFAGFLRDHAEYRMRDDPEVTCWEQLALQLGGQGARAAAVAAWMAARDPGEGCRQLGSALAERRLLRSGEIWQAMRLAVEANRPRSARLAAVLIGPSTAKAVDEMLAKPARLLERHVREPSAHQQELATLALMRLAGSDVDAAAQALQAGWGSRLSNELAAIAWAALGRQAAWRQQERAHGFFELAWQHQHDDGAAPRWSDETLAWSVRAALRTPRPDRERWGAVLRGIEAMSEGERAEPAWAYWQARALAERARSATERARATAAFEALAVGVDYYAQLALQELGRPFVLPAPPPPPSAEELEQARQTPGLQRGLALAQLDLRSEGRREWNFTLRGMGERELLAAAELACRAADWQICINTSERTREQLDLGQRYPMPHAGAIGAQARERALEPALVFGLIRQETRFMARLRSAVGATGLMQVMPATARWTAKRIGLEMKPGQLEDIDLNLRLGTSYLRLVLDDFGGSQALAAAAYNAGPGRPRRWREGPVLDAAAWTENIPFAETRDYVKKVLANASVYAALLGEDPALPLRARLGRTIGPRETDAPTPDANLP